MADIELVVKIPEWKYKSICEGVEASKRCGVVGVDSYIHEAIYNGTPIPKGHGRLIDIKDLYEHLNEERDNNFVLKVDTIVGKIKPIIEANKEQENGNVY